MPKSPASKPVSFRASPQLIAAARKRAAREGTSWPASLRALLYDYAVGRCASPSIARECVRLARQLRAIGTNVNQIARALNSQSTLTPETVAQLQHDLAEVRDLVRRVHDIVLARRPPIRPWHTPSTDSA